MPLGESEEESVEAGDLVYCDEMRIRTRRWIWRQSDVQNYGRYPTNLFPIDGFANSNKEAVLAAAEELEALLKTHFHCETKRGFVDREHPGKHSLNRDNPFDKK